MGIIELEELLLNISYKDENEKVAVESFNRLYKEYSKIISAIIKKKLKSMGIYDEQLYQATINNVFFKLYEKPFSFSVPETAKNDNCFKSWLSIVSKNEVLSLLKEYKGNEVSLHFDLDNSVFIDTEVNTIFIESENLKLMKEALATLSIRDKEIMLTLYNFFEEGKNTPTETLNLIAEVHKTTKTNIRKIKERSEKKIIAFISEKSELIPVKNGK